LTTPTKFDKLCPQGLKFGDTMLNSSNLVIEGCQHLTTRNLATIIKREDCCNFT